MTVFEAEVVDVRLESQTRERQRWQMMLTRTEFTATASTGKLEAVARSGARLEVPVLGVVEDQGELWHLVEKPLAAGTAVRGTVRSSGMEGG